MKKILCFLVFSFFVISSCKLSFSSSKNNVPEEIRYKVSYESEYGIAPASILVVKDKVLTDEELPEMETAGCTFNGWYLKDDSEQKIIEEGSVTVTGDIVLEASWTPESFVVTYFPNGGSGSPVEQSFVFGTEIEIPENTFTAPEDMKFAFWNIRHDGKGASYTAGQKISVPANDFSLYACWISADSYSLVYKNCEMVETNENPGNYKAGEGLVLLPVEREGYIFNGWYLEDDFSGDSVEGWEPGTVKGSKILYAKWSPEKRTLTFTSGEGSEDPVTVEAYYDEIIRLPENNFTAPKRKFFSSWILGENEYKPGEDFGPVHENSEFTAKWNVRNAKTFIITYVPNGGSGEPVEKEALSEDEVLIAENTFTPPLDMKFAYWSTRIDGKGSIYKAGEKITVPEYDLNLFAVWEDADSYSLSYRNCEKALENENPSEYAMDQDVVLVPALRKGYVFDGWYLEDDFSGDSVEGWEAGSEKGSKILYAKWTPEKHILTFASEDDSFTIEAEYDAFAVLPENTFQAPEGKKFLSWTLDSEEQYFPGDSFGPVSEDVIFSIQWTDKNSRISLISYIPNGASGDRVEIEELSEHIYLVSDNIFTVPEDKKFAGWNTRRDGKGTVYEAGQEIEVPDYDLYLFAIWEEADFYTLTYKNCEKVPENGNLSEYSLNQDVVISDVIREGYTFDGWYLEEDFSGEEITGWKAGETKGSKTLYAKWTPEKRTVTYISGRSDEPLVRDMNYDDELKLEENTFPLPSGKKFYKWVSSEGKYDENAELGPIHDNLVFTAEFVYADGGDVAKKNIVLQDFEGNDLDLAFTQEVYVMNTARPYTIYGSNSNWNKFVSEDEIPYYKGAFIEGRNIVLDPFAMGSYPVTKELFSEVFGKCPSNDNGALHEEDDPRYAPVGGISWYMTIAFCNKLTLLTGGTLDDLVYEIPDVDWESLTFEDIPASINENWNNAVCHIEKTGYRLPTEAEWEFAARGGNTSASEWNYAYAGVDTDLKMIIPNNDDEDIKYSLSNSSTYKKYNGVLVENWGLVDDDNTKEYAWLRNNSEGLLRQVGLLKPNSIGLYDMSGLVWEWLWDNYADDPAAADELYRDAEGNIKNPMGPAYTSGALRLRKGSSVDSIYGIAHKASVAFRADRFAPNSIRKYDGFRICRTIIVDND